MGHIPIPRKLTIEKHFADAIEVVDLKTRLTVDIQLAKSPKFDNGQWLFGQVVIWQDGKYASVTKCKGGADCNKCKDKRKKK